MSSNGQLDSSELSLIPVNDYINTNGGQYIANAALDHLLSAARLFQQWGGTKLWVEEAYRNLATQEDYFLDRYVETPSGSVVYQGKRWSKRSQSVATAAVPGTSIHGLGMAVDLWSGIDTSFTSNAHRQFVQFATQFGWKNTGTAFGEPWHFEWAASRVTRAPIITASNIHPIPGSGPITGSTDDMSAQDITDIKAALGNITAILATENGGGMRGTLKARFDNVEAILSSSGAASVLGQIGAVQATVSNIETIIAKENNGGMRGVLQSVQTELDSAKATLANIESILANDSGKDVRAIVNAIKAKVGA